MITAFKFCLYKYKFLATAVVLVFLSVFFAFLIQTTEGVSVQSDYLSFDDCIWGVLVAITTVGYGDFVVYSFLGRMSMVFVSFVGILLVSLFIMTIQSCVQLSSTESKAYYLVSRIKMKEKLKETAEVYLKAELRHLVYKNRYLKAKKSSIEDNHKLLLDLSTTLKETLSKKISSKQKIRSLINTYNYEYRSYDEYEVMNKRLQALNDKYNEVNERKKKFCSLLNKINDQVY